MHAVHDERPERSGLHGGGVAGCAEQDQRRHTEQRRLPTRGEPVGLVVALGHERHPGREQDQQAMTGEPHVAGLSLEKHAQERGGIERGACAAFEDGGLPAQAGETEDDGHQQERPGPHEDAGLPGAGRGPAGRAREQRHRESAHDEHGGGQVSPANEQSEGDHATEAMLAFLFMRAIFFDAGNTLLRMNYGAIAQALAREGVAMAPEALARADWSARVRLDADLHAHRTSTESVTTADRYLRYVLEGAGVTDARVVTAVAAWRRTYNPPVGVWNTAEPLAAEALALARDAGLRTAVISNSNGSVRQILESLGLGRHLDFVLDSGEVGVEKPDARIFRLALERAGVAPAEAAYVGDLYSVDVLGAGGAGLRAVLLDPGGCWGQRDCLVARDVLEAVKLILARRAG